MSPHTPLEMHTRRQHLVYRSETKLNGFLMDKNKTAFTGVSLGLSARTASLTGGVREKAPRDLLDEVGRHLQDLGAVSYERDAVPGGYLLVRALCVAGSVWPSFGKHHQQRWSDVTFWVGGSAFYRLLAYGSRKHLLDGSAIDQSVATWSPSIAGAYVEMLNDIADASNLDGTLDPSEERSRIVTELLRYYFHDGVRRGDYVAPKAVYELLLRVDGVDQGEAGELPVVYGSPVWVARTPTPVSGTYAIGPSKNHLVPVADWSPSGWGSPRWLDHRPPGAAGRTFPSLPAPPEVEPSVTDLVSLSTSDWDAPVVNGPANAESAGAGRRRWWAPRFW